MWRHPFLSVSRLHTETVPHAFVFLGPYDTMENEGPRFWLFYYQSFFFSQISVMYTMT